MRKNNRFTYFNNVDKYMINNKNSQNSISNYIRAVVFKLSVAAHCFKFILVVQMYIYN